jgi:hypothetical protein
MAAPLFVLVVVLDLVLDMRHIFEHTDDGEKEDDMAATWSLICPRTIL